MEINGIQKLTLLDYPEHCACTLFLYGCNLRCPFCHNALLVTGDRETVMEEDKFFSFLDKRHGLLDGVCITGGEPTMREGLKDFLFKIKEKGFDVKLDTNGFFPKKLKEILDLRLADYVAMDIKNSLDLYSKTCGREVNTDAVLESISLIRESGVKYEFRTTCVKNFHTPQSISEAADLIKDADRYFLQNFVSSGALIDDSCQGLSKEEMKALLAAAQKAVPNAKLRGI